MNCDRVRAAISERMDGEHLAGRFTEAVDSHVETCEGCRAFESNARRLRTAVRIRPAEQIPDLTDRIMSAVAAEPSSRTRLARTRRRTLRESRPRHLAPVAAGLLVGLVAGSVLVGGPWERRSARPIAAADVVRGVSSAARTLDSYHASFAITEQGLPSAPLRHLSMEVWFLAPERFRLDVTDQTRYPTTTTPTNLEFIANGAATYERGPTGCPAGFPPGVCPPVRAVRSVRQDFSPDAPLPADLVLPLDVLSSPRGITVMGTGKVLGRPAVEVEMTFQRAEPLFPFLRLGGTWRPFFPGDLVHLWLSRTTWFPLRATVYPSSDPARLGWELRFGLPRESAKTPIIDVAATSFATKAPAPDIFAISGGHPNVVPISTLKHRVGFRPVLPVRTADLSAPTSAVVAHDGARSHQTLITYSSGLTYLKVGERRGATAGSLFDPQSQRVEIPNVGVAYYEPATADQGRLLAIHTAQSDLYLQTNLSREELLQVAASLPIQSAPFPSGTAKAGGSLLRVVTLAEAMRVAPFRFSPPASLPEGYVFASAQLSKVNGTLGVTLLFRQPESDLVGAPIQLYIQHASTLPPASSSKPVLVDLSGTTGRWSPDAATLEWLRGGVYYSLDAPGLDLAGVLAIANSIPRGSS